MKVKIICSEGDLACDLEQNEAQVVFNRVTGKSNEALPESILNRFGDRVSAVPGLKQDGRLSYAVFREIDGDHQKVKSFSDLGPDDSVLLMPPVVGG